jgi:hypothetical protein
MSENEPDDAPPNDDTGHAAKAAAILGAMFALTALGFYGTRAACSVLVGAAIAVANLLTMRAIIRALVQAPPPETEEDGSGAKPDPKRTGQAAGIGWALFAAFKILLLFGGVWILLTRHIVDPMPLVVGYGVLPLGITASALWSSLRSRS